MILLPLLLNLTFHDISQTKPADWSGDILISDGLTSYPGQHNIARDQYDNIYVTWFSWKNSTIGYKRLSQNIWQDVNIFPAGWMGGYPSIAANKTGTNIYICWQFNWFHNVLLKKCNNGIWEDTNRTISESPGYCYAPSMACDDNDMLHIVWEKNYEIYYKKFNGSSFSADVKISNSNVYAAYPDIESFNNNLTVVWEDLKDGNFEIYLREYSNQSWKPEIRITHSPGSSIFPSASIDSAGNNHITWQEEQTGGYKIFYATYRNGNLDTLYPCVESPGEAINPSITSEGNQSWLVWTDSRDGNWEIYYKTIKPDSMGEDTRLTYSTGNSDYPDILADKDENLFVTFCNSKDSISTVYFKENIIKKSDSNVVASIYASPNPFIDNITIQCQATGKENASRIDNTKIGIYDLCGRLIKSLHKTFNTRWNGTNEVGITVKPGIYFVRINGAKPLKLVKIK